MLLFLFNKKFQMIPSSILTFCVTSKLVVFSSAVSTDSFAISDNADMEMIAEAWYTFAKFNAFLSRAIG